MQRSLKLALPLLILLVAASAAPIAANEAPGSASDKIPGKGAAPPLSNTVGIRLTVSSVDPMMSSAELDLTMYTRGYGPYGTTTGGYVAYAGSPFLGYPAIDYGDGNSLATATLALTTSGGGPGGSNVYRSLASFSHAYPSLGTFTARAAMACVGCFQASFVVFPPGSPAPPTFTSIVDSRPTGVIGHLPLRLTYQGTTYNSFLSASVRYLSAVFPVVTNNAVVVLGPSQSPTEVPTASQWALIVLATALFGAGLVMLKRG